jgi:hypothetical protein
MSGAELSRPAAKQDKQLGQFLRRAASKRDTGRWRQGDLAGEEPTDTRDKDGLDVEPAAAQPPQPQSEKYSSQIPTRPRDLQAKASSAGPTHLNLARLTS